jgi:xanthine dehydrogenase accessory factor
VAAIVTCLDDVRRRMLVPEEGAPRGTLGDDQLDAAGLEAARRQMAGGTSGIVELGAAHRAYVEVHAPPVTLVVFGATHVAQPLVAIARVLGLRTVVVDGRERYATRDRFPEVDELLIGMPSEIAARLPITRSTMVVLLSHDYKYDLPVLRRVLEGEAAYVGCLGSARRGRAMLEFLADAGVARDALARVHVPVGLDIGARTPAEIALSVLAEALAAVRGRPGGAMRDRARGGGGAA